MKPMKHVRNLRPTGLCRTTLHTTDHTQCLRDRNFDLRSVDVHKMTYAKLTLACFFFARTLLFAA